MTAVTVKIRFVDGSYREFEDGPDLLARLAELQAEGWEGRQLINRLLTDDWGPPPVFVDICSAGLDGQDVEIRIPYQ